MKADRVEIYAKKNGSEPRLHGERQATRELLVFGLLRICPGALGVHLDTTEERGEGQEQDTESQHEKCSTSVKFTRFGNRRLYMGREGCRSGGCEAPGGKAVRAPNIKN